MNLISLIRTTLNNFKIKKFGSIDISINKKDKKINE